MGKMAKKGTILLGRARYAPGVTRYSRHAHVTSLIAASPLDGWPRRRAIPVHRVGAAGPLESREFLPQCGKVVLGRTNPRHRLVLYAAGLRVAPLLVRHELRNAEVEMHRIR